MFLHIFLAKELSCPFLALLMLLNCHLVARFFLHRLFALIRRRPRVHSPEAAVLGHQRHGVEALGQPVGLGAVDAVEDPLHFLPRHLPLPLNVVARHDVLHDLRLGAAEQEVLGDPPPRHPRHPFHGGVVHVVVGDAPGHGGLGGISN